MTGNSDNILEINSIEVMYDSVISALHDVSLNVPKGKIVALLGGNGAGKSTTLKSISKTPTDCTKRSQPKGRFRDALSSCT